MKLTKQQLATYEEKGWVAVEGVFDAATIERVVAEAMRISEARLVEDQKKGGINAITADRSADGQAAPRKVDNPFLASEVFRGFVLNPALEEMLEQIMGEKPLLARDQIMMKPPKFGSAKAYHQDNAYFKCSPPEHVVTAWIALDDVDESNGCLRYIDGSHREGLLPHEPVPGEPHNEAPPAELIDLSRESLAIVNKGGVVFHHGQTLHTSHRNTSDRWRRGYATHWLTASVTSDAPWIEKAYFKSNVMA